MKDSRPVSLAIACIVGWAWPACAQDVSLTDQGATVTLANGYLTATITKSNAKVTSLIYQGHQMVNTSSNGYIYFSMDGGAGYEQPSGCIYSVTTLTADMADISLRRVWSGTPHAFDIEIHYVLRRGDSRVVAYGLPQYPPPYPPTRGGGAAKVWDR